MPELTQKQKNKLLSAAKIVENGDFAVIEKFIENEDKMEEQAERIDAAIAETKTVIAQAEEAMANVRDGNDADEEAIEARVIEAVTSQFPKKEDIVAEVQSKIIPTIVERVIEKTEVVREQPIVNTEVTEVQVLDEKKLEESLPKYGEAVRNSLELLEGDERLDKSAIKGLQEEIEALRKYIANIPRGGGGGRASHAMKLKPLTADGVTKIFSVPKNVTGWVQGSDFPSTLYEGNGLTFNATRTQLTLGVDNAPSSGSQLLFIYSEVFNT